MYMDNIAKK